MAEGQLNQRRTEQVLLVIDTNAAFLQSADTVRQIRSAIDSVLRGLVDVNQDFGWGFKFIDSSVSSIAYERAVRTANYGSIALKPPAFHALKSKHEGFLSPYDSFHQALEQIFTNPPPVQAASSPIAFPGRAKHIISPVREAISVFPWDREDFNESPLGGSSATTLGSKQAPLGDNCIIIFTGLPSDTPALESFLGDARSGKESAGGQPEDCLLGIYRKTFGALKEATKQHSFRIGLVNIAADNEAPVLPSSNGFDTALREAGIGLAPLQALAFGASLEPIHATLHSLLDLPNPSLVETPVCSARLFDKLPVELLWQHQEGAAHEPPVLSVFGPKGAVKLVDGPLPHVIKWYQVPREDLDQKEQYVLKASTAIEGSDQVEIRLRNVLVKLHAERTVLRLQVEDEPFSFSAILVPSSPSTATLTLFQDPVCDLVLLLLRARVKETCLVTEAAAAELRQKYLALTDRLVRLPALTLGARPLERPPPASPNQQLRLTGPSPKIHNEQPVASASLRGKVKDHAKPSKVKRSKKIVDGAAKPASRKKRRRKRDQAEGAGTGRPHLQDVQERAEKKSLSDRTATTGKLILKNLYICCCALSECPKHMCNALINPAFLGRC
jgi:hypothetical protein